MEVHSLPAFSLIILGALQLTGGLVKAVEAARNAAKRIGILGACILGSSGAIMLLVGTLYLLSL